ncbi:MAG: DNA-3-methyladenine glycosylase [Synergistaceae bacterium]|nr:DNA-3-methyladenine glycosylase [Synergistaceae bacterium]
MMKLERNFYVTDGLTLAKSLLGKVLVRESEEGIASGIIVETEAYIGPEDKAAHTWKNRRTSRTEVIFGEGGYAYIYLVYGMHYCFNVTANIVGKPECVLVRALEPLDGIELMKTRRRTNRVVNLTNGPGKLCCALNITRELYGEDLCGERLYIVEYGRSDFEVEASPRIGIDYAEEYRAKLWRFCIKDSVYVSKKIPPA